MNALSRLIILENIAAAIESGALPNLPRPWEEMTDEEKHEFVNQFI